MFENLGRILKGRFNKKDYLARRVKIVKIFDMYKDGTKQVMGEEAKPVSLKDKKLIIQADSSSHANQLRLHEHEIVETINHHFGEEVINRVIYRF